jgi:hypothetical protein
MNTFGEMFQNDIRIRTIEEVPKNHETLFRVNMGLLTLDVCAPPDMLNIDLIFTIFLSQALNRIFPPISLS